MTRFLFLAAMGTASIYFFPSGQPQITDFLFLAFLLSIIINILFAKKAVLPAQRIPLIYLFFVIWIVFLNLSYSVIYNTTDFLRYIFFWCYNLVIVFTVLFAVYNNIVKNSDLLLGTKIALLACGIGVLYDLGTGSRNRGFFNNPNQLGYFSLVMLSLYLYFNKFKIGIGAFSYLALFSGIIGIVSSASLTAWGATAPLFIGILLYNLKLRQFTITFFSISLVGLGIFLFEKANDGLLLEKITNRITHIDTKIERFHESRRVYKISENPGYLIIGAGEGFQEPRFGDRIEIHNAFLNIAFNYGLIGITLFFGLLLILVWRGGLFIMLIIMPSLLYNLTHMGLRSTMFWLMITLIYFHIHDTKSASAKSDYFDTRQKMSIRPNLP